MKNYNNRNNNKYPNKINKKANKLNQNINNNYNLEKSHSNLGTAFSNLSDSTFGNFNTINNTITGSKIIKIKNITKKNSEPVYKPKKKEKEKEKEPLNNDSSSDYGNEEDDDFNNILKESIQSLNISTAKNSNNLENLTYNKLNEYFNNDINNIDSINKFENINPNLNTNKSININDYINYDKNIIESPKATYEENLLKKNKIFNNKEDIINLDNNNNISPKNEEYKIRLKNHNAYIDKKLKEINFFEKLKSISESRYLFFIENYRKNNYFLEENSFQNILISEKNLKIQSPLTLIFQKIFSPDNSNYPLGKNFFEKNFSSRGNSDYLSYYDKNELNKVPRFFNDLTYVNNLFNSFDFDELNNFLEEIKNWENTFNYQQEYVYQIKYFKQKKQVNLKNNLIIYFISPYDLIIDSHLTSSGIPFADTVMALNQYIFHCDIKFDSKKGRFLFKTSVKILNSISMIKKTLINNTVKEVGKSENDDEIINNTWIPMKKEILEQDLINQKDAENIYNKYLENNINKFSNNFSDIKINDNDSEEIWDSFSEKNNKKEIEENYMDIEQINNIDNNINDLNERNAKILKMGGYILIAIYLFKIFFFSFCLDTIFGIFWIGLIGYLIYKFRN